MKISIITVSFNSSKTIINSINSVNNQNYKNIEHIFIDGNSDDGTFELIKKYSTRSKIVISEPDEGLYDAMNKGIKIATGDIIGILNSDDIFSSTTIISIIADAFKRNKCDILYGNINYINNENKNVRYWKSSKFIKGTFKNGWHPPHPSLFIKKDVYDNYGNFDISLKISSDFDLMLRFFEKSNNKCFYLDKTIVNMMIGGRSNTIKGIIKGSKEIKLAFTKNKIKPAYLYLFNRYMNKIFKYLKS